MALIPAGPDRQRCCRWENGYRESFNGKLRDELLDGEVFYSLAEAKVVIESWRRHYNSNRPHSALGYRPPAPEVVLWPNSSATRVVVPRPAMHQHSPRTTHWGPVIGVFVQALSSTKRFWHNGISTNLVVERLLWNAEGLACCSNAPVLPSELLNDDGTLEVVDLVGKTPGC